jgi:CheY-like chemotaxis protein
MAKILIIDDSPANRSFLITLLGYFGHSIREASDGAEALALASTEAPDLVIADILMPTMDGYEFVRRLRAISELATTPVIFCTAHFGERDAQDLAKQCGVEQVLTNRASWQRFCARLMNPCALPHPQRSNRCRKISALSTCAS